MGIWEESCDGLVGNSSVMETDWGSLQSWDGFESEAVRREERLLNPNKKMRYGMIERRE